MFTLRVLWMFLWEVFMGKESYKIAYKRDKMKVILFIMTVVLLVYGVFTTQRLVAIGLDHVRLIDEMEAKKCLPASVSRESDAIITATATKVEETQSATALGIRGTVDLAASAATTGTFKAGVTTKQQAAEKMDKVITTTPTTETGLEYDRKSELIKQFEDL